MVFTPSITNYPTYQKQLQYLNVKSDFLHDVHPLRKRFGHFLHTVEILHRLLDISVLLQQLKLT